MGHSDREWMDRGEDGSEKWRVSRGEGGRVSQDTEACLLPPIPFTGEPIAPSHENILIPLVNGNCDSQETN